MVSILKLIVSTFLDKLNYTDHDILDIIKSIVLYNSFVI